MAPASLSGFTQQHNFVAGVIVMAIGVAGIIGSVSGNLAAMLAALFDPTDLYVTSSVALGNAPAIPGPGGLPSGGGSPPANGPALPGAPALPGGGGGLDLPQIGGDILKGLELTA